MIFQVGGGYVGQKEPLSYRLRKERELNGDNLTGKKNIGVSITDTQKKVSIIIKHRDGEEKKETRLPATAPSNGSGLLGTNKKKSNGGKKISMNRRT